MIHTFFAERLPAALAASAGFKSAKGTLAIIVEGDGGGSWTVQLGNVAAPVLDTIDDDDDHDADCIAILTVPAFEALNCSIACCVVCDIIAVPRKAVLTSAALRSVVGSTISL